ncbi:hypothetical protein DFH08DRAFT_812168 [Mycena albidolilacea]|uniref:Uncharacterized protein n=1 Tax=Mycena albidolilacea TaxID=1033008 RepID=A0AAD6ZU46_9AGAR|nr:hypothetical protein DFH08DRAFT_812168 [Mycena albidolilacea]
MIFSRVVQQLGTGYSWLSPKWYTLVFLPFNIIALVVQGVGDGIASSASDLAGANQGAKIMLGGIAFQFGVFLSPVNFYLINRDFAVATRSDWWLIFLDSGQFCRTKAATICSSEGDHKIVASATSATPPHGQKLIGIRIDLHPLTGGWTGRIFHTEVYFNVLDGWMVTLAIFTLNFAHPGVFLRPSREEAKAEAVKLMSMDGVPVGCQEPNLQCQGPQNAYFSYTFPEIDSNNRSERNFIECYPKLEVLEKDSDAPKHK